MTNIPLIVENLKEIEDFRHARGQRYKLYNLLTMSILAIVAGSDDFESMATFCEMRSSFLSKHGLLEGERIPSHDLFRWIFMHLDKTGFAFFLSAWLEAMLSDAIEGNKSFLPSENADPSIIHAKMIHVDGKSLRATRTSEHTRTALQIVSAYCSNLSLTLGQSIIDSKSCEKTAIPELLNLLDLKYAVVTIDAIATSKKNTEKIIAKGGDYILALKKNNQLLYADVDAFFDDLDATDIYTKDYFQTIDNQHGRTEIRTCRIIDDLDYFPNAEQWYNLKSVVCIDTQRTIKGKETSYEKRYYLTSLPSNSKQLQYGIRKHWSVENQLHWQLDVAFNEDKSRLKDKNAAAVFATMRRFALAVIKNAKISQQSIKTQRLQAAWNDDFLDKLFKILKKTY